MERFPFSLKNHKRPAPIAVENTCSSCRTDAEYSRFLFHPPATRVKVDMQVINLKGSVMNMLSLLITLIMAVVIGSIGSAIAPGAMPGGMLGSMIAGFVGAWLGALLLGSWGPVIGGFAVLPAIIGSALFVFLLGLLARGFGKRTA